MDLLVLLIFIIPVVLMVFGLIMLDKSSREKTRSWKRIAGILLIIIPFLFLLYVIITMVNFFSGPPPVFQNKQLQEYE